MRRLTYKTSILNGILLMGLLTIVAPDISAYTVGDTVADFTLPDADGQLVSLSDFNGSVLMINFWTSG